MFMTQDSGVPPATADDTRAFYDRVSRAYDLLAHAGERQAVSRGLAALAPAPGETVADVGCGTGHAVVDLARAVGTRGGVLGIDRSSGMLGVAHARLMAEGVSSRARLCLGDARQLPVAPGRLDAVFSSFTLELFEDRDIPVVLAEVARALRPGGRLGVVALDDATPHGTVTEVYLWLHRHFPHFVDCRPIQVTRRVEDAGFAVRERAELSIWGIRVVALVAVRAGP